MRVLIVDDHAVLRDGLKNILDEPRGTAVCHEASKRPVHSSSNRTGISLCSTSHLVR